MPFFLRHMILKRDLPFESFRYMLSKHNFFRPSEISTRIENSTIFIIFTLFWCFHCPPNYQQLHVLSIHFILHQICKKIHMQNWTKITKHITMQQYKLSRRKNDIIGIVRPIKINIFIYIILDEIIRGERVDGHKKLVVDGSSANVQGSRIPKPASERIKSSAEAIVFKHITKALSRYSWVEYMIEISFLRRDSLYYCMVICLVILVQFCKCIFLQM